MKVKILPFIPLLLIIILPLIFFGQASLGKQVIVSGDFTGSDLWDLNYPFKVAIHEAFKNRFIPLWTPYLDGGYPLLAEGQMGFFYPINLILAPFPPYLALTYSIIIAFILAGLTTYLYARTLKLSRFSSLISAITFMFSAFFITRLKHLNLIAVASLFPLGLFWIAKFWEKLKIKYLIGLGITIGCQFLAGHPQMAFYCFLAYLWAFFFQFFTFPKSDQPSPLGKALTGFLLASFIGLGIGAIQILPTLEMTILSSRPGYVFEQLAMYPFHPKNLITFFSPYFFGNPATGSYRQNIRDFGVFWENSSYIGLLPILLALWAIFNLFKKWRSLKEKKTVLFFTLTAIICLLLMLGQFTPFFAILTKSIPLAGLFRFPTRFNLFLIFSLAILAGQQVSLLVEKLVNISFTPKTKPFQTRQNPASEKEEIAFSWPLDKTKTQALLAGFILADLFVFGKNYLGFAPTSQWLKKPDSVQFLETDKSFFRIYSVSQYSESPYQTLGWKYNLNPHLAIKEAVPPNANINYKIGTISDRSWFEGGLPIQRHQQFENWLLNKVTNEFMLGKVLGMFNVKYILTYAPTQISEFELKKEIDLGKEFGQTLKIYENKQFMDHAFFVPEFKVINNEEKILEELASLNFYSVKTVILEENPPILAKEFTGILDEFRKANQINIEKYEPLELKIKTSLKNEGFLVLADTPYPGWKVKVDNQPGKLFTANYLQRAIFLKPGEHKIHFYYDPLSFKIGAIISGITVLVLLSVLILKILKKKIS